MKPAICAKCKKDLKHQIPDDAGEVVCFACDNPTYKRKRQKIKHLRARRLRKGRA